MIMIDEIHEECGVFAIESVDDAVSYCYYGLHSLQHRGQEAAGICVVNHHKMIVHKGEGLVFDVFTQDQLAKLKGNMAIGHVRYSTAGGSGIMNVQPFLFRTMNGSMAIAHNGNIVNANELKKQLEKDGSIFASTSDTEVLGHLIKRAEGCFVDRICQALRQLDGAFAFVIMIEDRIYGARDCYGLRPLSLGRLPNGSYVLASETCAFDVIGADFIRNIEPGEVICIKNQLIQTKKYRETNLQNKMCAMEYVYFSRPDSTINGINVHSARKRAGEILYQEAPVEGDIVIGIPDSSLSAAIGYAKASHIPYEMGLIKNKYVGRTFIQPTQTLREQSVKLKLSIIKEIVAGKRVIIIDDSIVRGTTSRRIICQLKEAGAKEVHVRIASPAIKYPCFYGVDTSTLEELISHKMDIQQLCNYLQADSLAFLSKEGLKESIDKTHCNDLCMSCFDGQYVTKLYDSFEHANKEEK
ncbi:MAG: amidophosphoribosyltransferase [[Clostridium] cocleatum]|nr:amidophosphoribosyltransferase [Thomasclavelia cocleata]MCI9131221.1 amidophosphoribosyltransferase [Thomasclavelia cocleata]MCI9629382.1 amidophosphoribosyltransferase [Thomasclavelia cocleata]